MSPGMASAAGGRITAGVGANLIGQHAQDRNQDATVYCGNLDPQVKYRLCSAAGAGFSHSSCFTFYIFMLQLGVSLLALIDINLAAHRGAGVPICMLSCHAELRGVCLVLIWVLHVAPACSSDVG